VSGFIYPEPLGSVMSAETGDSEPDPAHEPDEEDRRVFTRLGIMTIVWVILLIISGLLLLFYGPALADLVV